MTSWCRIRLRSERKMRNRNDSEGDCEVVEELRATYSERKREDEKTGTVPYKKMFLISVTAAFFIGCYDGFYGPGTGTFLLLVFTGAAKMDTRSASAQTKVINLSSNIAALVTFIIAGNVYYPLGLAAAACSVAGNYLGSGLVVHDGQKIVRPVVLVVLGILFIKILTGN